MSAAPLCESAVRLEALRRYRILDTPVEPAFDDVAKLAAYLCDAPLATITLVDASRQWFKSEVGMGVRETSLEHSICARAIEEEELLLVPDARHDPRFAEWPMVAGAPYLRFYAGVVLRSADGHPLGTLCVIDFRPRKLTSEQLTGLKTQASQVMTQLELRRSVHEQGRLIEEQKRTQAELHEARAAAEAASEAKSRFLANLSHELRMPLNPVLMATAAMQEHPGLPKEIREDLEMIRRNVELETRLIDDMLDLTRIQHGKLELQAKTFDLHAAIRHATETCVGEARKKEIDLSMELTAGERYVTGDAGRMQQALWNLIKNAVKFTPVHGRVTIRSRNVGSDRIAVDVMDTGIGLQLGEIEALFQPFQQGDPSINSRFGGLGLGLAISDAIVKMHDGALTAESKGAGCGSTFTLELAHVPTPQPAPGESAVPKVTQSAPPEKGGLRILLVEDHESTVQILRRLLERSGFEVLHANNCREAVELARTGEFDLLISDLGLPDGTGLDLVRALHREHSLPAIALSGYGMETDLAASREAGFSEHLTKPVVWQQLQAAISRVRRGMSTTPVSSEA